jgi:hypothetical protein
MAETYSRAHWLKLPLTKNSYMTENRFVYPISRTMCLKNPQTEDNVQLGIFLSKQMNPYWESDWPQPTVSFWWLSLCLTIRAVPDSCPGLRIGYSDWCPSYSTLFSPVNNGMKPQDYATTVSCHIFTDFLLTNHPTLCWFFFYRLSELERASFSTA